MVSRIGQHDRMFMTRASLGLAAAAATMLALSACSSTETSDGDRADADSPAGATSGRSPVGAKDLERFCNDPDLLPATTGFVSDYGDYSFISATFDKPDFNEGQCVVESSSEASVPLKFILTRKALGLSQGTLSIGAGVSCPIQKSEVFDIVSCPISDSLYLETGIGFYTAESYEGTMAHRLPPAVEAVLLAKLTAYALERLEVRPVHPSASAAAESDDPITWSINYPFAVPASEVIESSTTTFEEPQKDIDLPVGAGSLYEARSLAWDGWGSATAEANGKVRYCSETCEPWRSATITLADATVSSCGEGAGSHRWYATARLKGFDYIEDGASFPNALPPC